MSGEIKNTEFVRRLAHKLEIADRKGIRLGQYGNQASSHGGHLHDDIRLALALLEQADAVMREVAAWDIPKSCDERIENWRTKYAAAKGE